MLRKREAYRRAFSRFDPEKVARYSAEAARLVLEAAQPVGIVGEGTGQAFTATSRCSRTWRARSSLSR